MVSVTDSLKARLSALATKASRHAAALQAVNAEMSDIQIAIRVLEKHGGTSSAPQPQEGPASNVEVTVPSTAADAGKNGEAKLSMPEMIMEALASDATGLGMLPQNVVDYIHLRYDPSADANHIRPGLWRLHKRERIGKTGDRYHLLDRPPSSPTLWPVNVTINREAGM